MIGRVGRLGVVVAVLVVLASACSDDGRDLRAPAAGATAPPPPLSTSTVPPTPIPTIGGTIAVASTTFAPDSPIPSRYSCSGGNVSPPLSWSGVPAGTAELAIVVVDLDAGGFIHWVIAGLDPALTGLQEDERPESAIEARNDTSEFGWYGPCPPEGETITHRYAFTVYALGVPLGLQPGVGGNDAIAAIEAAAIDRGTLVGTASAATG